jgi:mono/diheme cytochrome c family protein
MSGRFPAVVVSGLAAVVFASAAVAPSSTGAAGPPAHVHVAVPDEYRLAHVPESVWTSAAMVARGKEIYAARCAVCHGDTGDGQGTAAPALPLRPPDLRDADMSAEMAGNYWFWRISEGGSVEPFRSQGSTMPAWKDVLSPEDRWAVIAYQHTFSRHEGPHVTSEHPQMLGGSHGGP